MDILASIFAFAGVGLNLWPVVKLAQLAKEKGLSLLDLWNSLTGMFAEIRVWFCVLFVAMPLFALSCGIYTIGSTKKNLWRVIGLALCALPPLYSAYVLYFRESWAWRFYPKELRDNFSQTLIISLGVGVCYALAAFCSYFVGGGKSRVKSQDTSSLDNFLKFENTNTVSSLSAKTFEPVLGVETSALIKRGKIFLSDDDFDEAERYFEQALRQDPENSQAYLGKLMAQKRVHNTDELARIDSQLSEEKLFRRALEFADDAKKQELMLH